MDGIDKHPRRVLIIGDSNCLPRRDGKYSDSWVCLLRQAMPHYDCIILADGSRTTEFLALYPRTRPDGTTEYDPSSLEMYDASIVIINLGIVDCAPRLFSRFESRFISTLRESLRNLIIATAKRLRHRSINRAYVGLDAFKENVRQYVARCLDSGVEKTIIIGIPTPDLRGVRRNPEIRVAVSRYNTALAEIADVPNRVVFIDPLRPDADVSPLYVEDGYHLSTCGHRMVFQSLMKVLGLSDP